MTPEIHDLSTLKLKLKRTTGKPASFLVGAPFSWDEGRGVPPVGGFIELIRKRVAAEGSSYSEDLEKRLEGAGAAGQYQAAMSFVYTVFDADVVSEIVQDAVLSARKPGSPVLDPTADFDGDPNDWDLSRGQRGLAHLVKLDPNRFPGPVFTTNFDPMIGLALQQQGIRYRPYTIPLEGSLNAPISVARDEVNIFHLHGYWRNSPTLHSPEQLEAKRQQLQASLEKHLNQTNLVVMAYSGWDDIFTSALANCLSTDTFSGTVTWCFYGNSPAEIREQNAALFEKFKGGIQQGRITFFHGVNCHTFLDELIADLGFDTPTRSAIESSPLAGWEVITTERLDNLTPLTGDEAVRFFDGAIPTLRHAISPLIPRLSQTARLVERIDQGLANTAACTMQVVRAAGGEGKSTALLQAAVTAATERDCIVLHRPSTDAGLNPDVVASFDPAHRWVLVADDAEGLISDLWECAVRMHDAGRHNVTFLLAARDADWIAEKGDQKGWNGRLTRLDDLVLGGINEGDAELVVDAWSEQGDAGLRGLMSEKSRDERIKKLVAATRAQDVKAGDGSFFGGLLDTRFSAAALLDHVVTLMEPLRDRDIDGGTGTLYDALLYVANCHAVGMPGLEKRVLASICDLPVNRVSTVITGQLGRELGAAESRGHILTRHRRVAEAVTVASETRFGSNLEDIWDALVEHIARLGREEKDIGECFNWIIHAGSRLKRSLPSGLDDDRRGAIAVEAAYAAVKHQPEWLGVVVDLARALRLSGRPAEACKEMSDRLKTARGKQDLLRIIRGYFYEWSTCAGNLRTRQGSLAGAWLAAFSLSDSLPPEVTLERAKLSCAGLGVAFENLLSGVPDSAFAKGRRAATHLGWQTNPDPRAAGYFERHQSELDEAGTPVPADNDEALVWLSEAAQSAHAELDDALLRNLQKNGRLTFKRLRECLDKP
ncbi:P-loop NTPase [Thalassovita mangrovi]|uniref:Novel STAND NTPase 5 domain-containing protein n=1 Tax=Thalassovita mangrovi TaxID=2692236 RepID=A0A6L8LFT7_9RHOB|nr:SIR2 family protein [Thalassovita mangrovi]MYM54937.1 hypothetical protein [Thalassovita mangrovi]